MITTELKKQITEKLRAIEDVEFLKALKALISRRDKPNYLELDEELIQELTLTKEDAENENYITKEALGKKLRYPPKF